MMKVYVSVSILFIVCGLCLGGRPLKDRLEREIEQMEALYKAFRDVEKAGLGAAEGLSSEELTCTNGKVPSQMSNSEYLDEFRKGPCTPLIVLAGLSGTKLRLTIDCEVLKSSHPDIFSQCGWDSCVSPDRWDFWFRDAPKREYNVWMPDLIAPFSLIHPLPKAKTCLSRVLGIDWEEESGSKMIIKQRRGIFVDPYGFTAETRRSSLCGFDSICNLMPVGGSLAPNKFRQFDELRQHLERKGYKIGLTLQAIPYDWRMSMYDDSIQSKLWNVIDKMFRVVGKKVSFAAHSFGNLLLLNLFSKMSQQEKDMKIMRHFAIGAPFLGAPSSFFMLIGGSKNYQFKNFGIDFFTMKHTLARFPAVFNLMPKNTWSLFQGTTWMKSIENRIREESNTVKEHNLSEEEDIVSSIFPSTGATCFPQSYVDKASNCLTEMKQFERFGSIELDEVTVNNLKEILNKYSYSKTSADLYEQEKTRQEYNEFKNSGVQTTIIYSSLIQTLNSSIYSLDPKLFTQSSNADFVEPDIKKTSFGDNAVLPTSTLLPGIKWADEFKRNYPGSKPVIFAEVCSEYNRKESIYQSSKSEVNQNEYQGIGCNCIPGGEDSCGHLGMLTDKKVVDYIFGSLLDNQQSPLPNAGPKNDGMDEALLSHFVDECELVNRS